MRRTQIYSQHGTQELMAVPGIDIVGPLPGNLQETFIFSAAVVTDANDVKAAKALIEFSSYSGSTRRHQGEKGWN